MAAFDFVANGPEAARSWLVEHGIRLTLEEATTLQQHILNRPPTRCECLLWSIQGSEHCAYKSSKSYLKTLPTQAPQVLLAVGEDAGIVTVATDDHGKRYGIAMSHESHNHPSQKVPYEGAATGVGGNVRDINCMGARVIASAESLRFGDAKAIHAVWQASGVIAGIADYGNAIGVPNLAGDLAFHTAYGRQCLVTVTSLGAVAEDRIIHSYVPSDAAGYALVLIGKATDNSGFGGASFASSEVDVRDKHRGAVQEPNAFLKQHLLKANQALFAKLAADGHLPRVAFKDLGAGGIACASVEMADQAGLGCQLHLDKVPLAMASLDPTVILLSETQERFLWAVPASLVEQVLQHYNQAFDLPNLSVNAAATVIGEITTVPRFVVAYQQTTLVDALASDVTRGIVVERPLAPAVAISRHHPPPMDVQESPYDCLQRLLAEPAIANPHPQIRRYDKQVQGRTVLERGTAAAGVLAPFADDQDFPQAIANTGVALATGHSPWMAVEDSRQCAMHAVLFSAQSVACVGAMPLAITDCLCFGNPEIAEHMRAFVDSVDGIRRACESLAGLANESPLPVVAGNVSFYNAEGQHSVPPSPLVSCLGQISNVEVAVGGQCRAVDADIWWLTDSTDGALGGSLYAAQLGWQQLHLPLWDWARQRAQIHAVIEAVREGWVIGAMPVAPGGILTTLLRMALPQQVGLVLEHADLTNNPHAWFSEHPGLLLQVYDHASQSLSQLLEKHAVSYHHLGRTLTTPTISLHPYPTMALNGLFKAWNNGLGRVLW